MYKIKLNTDNFLNLPILIFALPFLVFTGPTVQFMVLEPDGIGYANDSRSFVEFIISWWNSSGINRILGEGTAHFIYQIPNILFIFKLAPIIDLISRLLIVVTALRLMGRNESDSLWLIGLALVTPFWLDPALLLVRSIYELMSALVFYFMFSKPAVKIGIGRIFSFAMFQVLFNEAFLIPGLGLIWFIRRLERKSLYIGVGLFSLVYLLVSKLGLLTSSKFIMSTQQNALVVNYNGVSTSVPYAGKLTQLVNSVQAATPIIILISLILSVILFYLVRRHLNAITLHASNAYDNVEINITRHIEFILTLAAPVFLNWVVSVFVGTQGRVYWIILSYSWLLFILLSYYCSLHIYLKKYFTYFISFIFFLSTILVLELHTDLYNRDIEGFSGGFFRGFTSHFGFW